MVINLTIAFIILVVVAIIYLLKKKKINFHWLRSPRVQLAIIEQYDVMLDQMLQRILNQLAVSSNPSPIIKLDVNRALYVKSKLGLLLHDKVAEVSQQLVDEDKALYEVLLDKEENSLEFCALSGIINYELTNHISIPGLMLGVSIGSEMKMVLKVEQPEDSKILLRLTITTH